MFKKNQKINEPNILFRAFLGFMAGICLARQNLGLAAAIIGVSMLFGIAVCLYQKTWRWLSVLCCLVLGIVRADWLQMQENWTAQIQDNTQIVCLGRIDRIRTKDEKTFVTLNHLSIEGVENIPAYHSLTLESSQNFPVNSFQIHQFISVTGIFSMYSSATNEGEFDYQEYYRSVHNYGKLEAQQLEFVNVKNRASGNSKEKGYFQWLYQLHKELSLSIEQLASEEDVGIFKAIVLGDTADVTEEIQDLYQQSGISHILAVSGLHISLFGKGLYQILCWLVGSRYLSGALSGLVMVSYCVMIGSGIGAVRATIGFLLFLLAQMLGRHSNPLFSLAFAGFFLLWKYPMTLFQSGFQLSFAAIAGVHILAPYMQMCMNQIYIPCIEDKKPNFLHKVKSAMIQGTHSLEKTVTFGIAVQLAVMPVILWHEYVWPSYGLVLNLVLVPLMGCVLLSGAGCAVMGMFLPNVGIFMAGMGHYILRFYQFVCEVVQKLPGSRIVRGRPESWQIWLWLVGMISFIVYMKSVQEKRKLFYYNYLPALAIHRKQKEIQKKYCRPCYLVRMTVFASGFIISLYWFHYVPNEGLYFTCLDVGQGDAIVCEMPNGETLCIDGGSSNKRKVGKQIIEPYLLSHGIAQVDNWVITHPDSDHYSGVLELLQRGYSIGHLWMAEVFREDELVTELQQMHAVEWIHAKDRMQCNALQCEVLYPKGNEDVHRMDGNDLSVVMLLTFGNIRMLFTGDMGFAGEKEVVEALQGRKVDILKVAHHGSKNATSEAFLDSIQTDIALISCGKKNLYGHPHQELLARLEDAGVRILRTDQRGMIHVTVYSH